MAEEIIMAIAINCDMGESFGLYKLGDDAAKTTPSGRDDAT